MKNLYLLFVATLTLSFQANATKIQCVGYFTEDKGISMNLEIIDSKTPAKKLKEIEARDEKEAHDSKNNSSKHRTAAYALVNVNGIPIQIAKLENSDSAIIDEGNKYELLGENQNFDVNFSFDKYSQEVCEIKASQCPETSRRLLTKLSLKNTILGINLSGVLLKCNHAAFLLNLVKDQEPQED